MGGNLWGLRNFNMKLKKLPIGIQTFSNIVESNYFYIDKTQDVLEIIEDSKYIFLSRPRRFGKSLFLDTLRCVYEAREKLFDGLYIKDSTYLFLSRPRRFGKSLFLDTLRCVYEGRKELFDGLYIHDKYDWSKKHPVIKIDFFGDLRSPESLKKNILGTLRDNQRKLDIKCEDITDFGECFKDLIQKANEKYNQKVVVLVDEYDKAILDNLDQMDIAFANREIIKSLYTVNTSAKKNRITDII